MTPAVGWVEADYWRASRACHRAWVQTSPQYVIPGVLEQADRVPVGLLEPAALGEPPFPRGGLDRSDPEPNRSQRSRWGSHLPLNPASVTPASSGVSGSPRIQAVPGRNSPEEVRGQGQEGV